jgi:hypothetical protein
MRRSVDVHVGVALSELSVSQRQDGLGSPLHAEVFPQIQSSDL